MKTKRRQYPLIHETTFRNMSEQNLAFRDVMNRIERFIAQDPRAVYDLVITTDAQTHSGHTKFVSCIVVYRVGRGAWLCGRQIILPREIFSVQEKLSLETSYSQEIAGQFGYTERARLEDIIVPYIDQGADIRFIVDIDGGSGIKNKTAAYLSEMVGRIEAMGLVARVKPESVMVSIADRETKKPYRLGVASNT
ncbi:ribonuclease H-like YkuK family protein [Paenibacillus harenae]|uniref:ribonuclease H-like YkuK family protein n=1 Tax=Paenibacillus harenae TaxID=306543 RepID=UPI00048C822B|nr:ribonuclease H-like YkuK family protein [Paenibacillus harenae]